jgi:hypothetical protein
MFSNPSPREAEREGSPAWVRLSQKKKKKTRILQSSKMLTLCEKWENQGAPVVGVMVSTLISMNASVFSLTFLLIGFFVDLFVCHKLNAYETQLHYNGKIIYHIDYPEMFTYSNI